MINHYIALTTVKKMLTEVWASFRDNFNQKSRNPFFGTLIIIWAAKNWKLVYAVLTFDTEYKLSTRIEFIENYYKHVDFTWNLLACICLTVISLITSYLFINLSRLIINWFEKKVTPWVYKITDKNSVVLKLDFDKLREENFKLREKYEGERKLRLELRNQNEDLEKINIGLTEEKLKIDDEIYKLKLENDKIKQSISQPLIGNTITQKSNEKEKHIALYEKMLSKGFLSDFKNLILKQNEYGYFTNNDLPVYNGFKSFIFENDIGRLTKTGGTNFILTELGTKIKAHYQNLIT